MTRNMAIKWLKWIQNMFPEDSEQYKSLQLGINSVEVDEAYQLMYEQTTVHMREATPEEIQGVKKAVDDMSVSTGVSFYDARNYVLKDSEEWKTHYKNAFNDGFVDACKHYQESEKKMMAEIESQSGEIFISTYKVKEIINKYCHGGEKNEG